MDPPSNSEVVLHMLRTEVDMLASAYKAQKLTMEKSSIISREIYFMGTLSGV